MLSAGVVKMILLAVKKCKIDLPDIYKGLKAKAMIEFKRKSS